MNGQPQSRKAGPEPGQSSLGLEDIYYVLFRRKWLVIIGATLGILAAGAAYKLKKPLFQSQAKLLIKAIPDAPVLVTPGDGTLIKPPDPSGDKAMRSEREILPSQHIAHEVAEKVGPDRILPKKVRNPNVDPVDIAAGVIGGHLKVDTPNRTDVLSLQFQLWNPDVPQRVLNELIHAYFKAHDRIHRGDGELEEEKLERDVKEKQVLLTRIDDQMRQVRTNVG